LRRKGFDVPFVDWATRSFYVESVLGAFVLYVFSVGKGLPTADEFLKRILPHASISTRTFLDVIITVLVGAYVGILIVEPTTPKHGFISGLGWVATFNALTSPSRGMNQMTPKARTSDSMRQRQTAQTVAYVVSFVYLAIGVGALVLIGEESQALLRSRILFPLAVAAAAIAYTLTIWIRGLESP
jgi:hypothetical protein